MKDEIIHGVAGCPTAVTLIDLRLSGTISDFLAHVRVLKPTSCVSSCHAHVLLALLLLLRKMEEREAARTAAETRSHQGLTAFSLSMRPGGGGSGGGEMTAAEDGSTDISVLGFSIAAPKVTTGSGLGFCLCYVCF